MFYTKSSLLSYSFTLVANPLKLYIFVRIYVSILKGGGLQNIGEIDSMKKKKIDSMKKK